MNRFRRVLNRWEKLAKTYLGFLHLACAVITWRAIGLLEQALSDPSNVETREARLPG
jgi:hypothetical protein